MRQLWISLSLTISLLGFSGSREACAQPFPADPGLPLTIEQLAVAQVPAGLAASGQFYTRELKDDLGTHKYTVFLPKGYDSTKRYPTVLFLHGAGEIGKDGLKPLSVGLGPAVTARRDTFPMIVVFPQSEDETGRLTGGWLAGTPSGERAIAILEAASKDFAIDPKKVTLAGWSMGGFGAWSLGEKYADRFQSVLIASGGGNPVDIGPLKNTPAWALHGAKDKLVPPASGKAMADALAADGGSVTFTEFPESGHDLTNEVFNNDSVIEWLKNPAAKPAYQPTTAAAKAKLTASQAARPFTPAIEIPRAMAVRLGNRVLDSVAASAPQMVGNNGVIYGRIADIFDSTTASGRQFSVQFSNISYSARLERVVVQGVAPERLRIQLGLRNATLTIGGTYINGARHAAQTSAIGIYMGFNRPEWLTVDVRPYLENGRLRFQPLNVFFSIAPDNWSISQPGYVSAQGFGLTEAMVRENLMSGLYSRKGRIESEVRNAAPTIVAQLENQLNLNAFGDASALVSAVWPLPTSTPQVRLIPQEIVTDAQGVSMVMALQAASLDPLAKPARPEVVKGGELSVKKIDPGLDLRVAVSPEVLGPLTQLAIDSGLSRVNVMDAPEPSFAKLADPEFLKTILPGLSQLPAGWEANTMFVLTEPIQLATASDLAGALPASEKVSAPLVLKVNRALLKVGTRTDATAAFKPTAEFELSIAMPVQVVLKDLPNGTTTLQLVYPAATQVTANGKYAPDFKTDEQTIENQLLADQLSSSWTKWISTGEAAASALPPVQLGQASYQISQILATNEELAATLETPSIRITNKSEEAFTYETKGLGVVWGGPYTLKPGETHRYRIASPLTYRRLVGSTYETYTLTPGSRSEFRVPREGGAPRLFEAKN
ncbi:Alpha/beta hydrolase family protein [Planctopirus ephydatiae]|uniref:Alpha/beta hydrolase family protein n=1 Tax=Planctopirus ephydatiae TaxID=2528019 RepID=A0A518GUA4_9PLAN|nr:alpha/beta hydrolase-fold protein [Planctopirus ephydatiae]QDV32165.1 Alpha/beta hydrolase family protein [Planctopirus ephydatiae]